MSCDATLTEQESTSMPRRAAVLPLMLSVAACRSAPSPSPEPVPTQAVECHLNPSELCGHVLAAARAVAPLAGARLVIVIDRGPVFHADVHACYPDGRYILVDVVGDGFKASVRPEGWESPPCRGQ